MLRKLNPTISIFGLYGGSIEESFIAERELGVLLDDFFCYPHSKDRNWKWRNGDLLINEWFQARGQFLTWDTIIVVQWDMLLLGNVAELFSELRKDEILLSSLRPVEDVMSHWFWVSREQPVAYSMFESFHHHIENQYGLGQSILACHFIVACLPRRFLEQYSSINVPETGFVEYRVPTFAKLFNTPFSKSKRFDSWWADAPEAECVRIRERVLIPTGRSIPIARILFHLLHRNGARVFHPFVYTFPVDLPTAISFLFNKRRLVRVKMSLKKLALYVSGAFRFGKQGSM
jgi:hypothetical protein